jgi:cytochrome o ubiquinol oxidase subunit 2
LRKERRPGVFEGENTQFNGIGFTEQKFNAVGMTQQDFASWVATVKSQGVALNGTMYAYLGNRSTL